MYLGSCCSFMVFYVKVCELAVIFFFFFLKDPAPPEFSPFPLPALFPFFVEETLPVEAIVLGARDRPEDRARLPFAGSEREVDEMLRAAHTDLVAKGVGPAQALVSLAKIGRAHV